MTPKPVKKYDHTNYSVDAVFKRPSITPDKVMVHNPHISKVSELNELQAKDLCCLFMDAIMKMQSKADEINHTAEDAGFSV
jgi:hypothetical protein